MATLTSPRQSLTTINGPFISPRQSLTTIQTFVSPRQSLTTIKSVLTSARQSGTQIWGSTMVALTTNPGTSEWVTNARNLISCPLPDVTYSGINLAPILGDLTLTAPLNGKSTADFTLANPSTNGIVTLPSAIAPPGTGTYANKIRQHDGTSTRSFVFTVDFADQTWTSETLMPIPPSYNGRQLKWGAEDYTGILEQPPGSFLDDILRGDGDNVMAHAAMKQTADAIGIPVECRFRDYLIGEYRRGSGSRLSHMDALAKPMQAGRRFENGRLIYETVDTTAPVMWRFVDRLNIRNFEVTEYPRQPNSFVLARFSPAGGQIGEGSGNTVGRQSVTFTASRFVAVDIMKCVQGRLDDWIFFSEAGAVLSSVSPTGFYSGAVPAARAEFTYYPNIGNAAYTPYYDIVVRGEQAQPDGSYRFTADDSAHQAAFGTVVGPVIADPILGDATGAQYSVDAYLAESVRKVYRGTLETPYLNPFIRPGHVVSVADHLTAQSSSTRWIVEQVQLIWKARSWSMQLELSRGL